MAETSSKVDGVTGGLFEILMIFESRIGEHDRYIKKVLSVALKYGHKMFGNDGTFQQDRASPHTYEKSQLWGIEHCPPFIDKDRFLPNSLNLNLLDY